MSLMAGFDLVAEISNDALRTLLIQNLKINGVAISPPFELTVPVTESELSGTIHVVVTDLELNLNANDTVTLILPFDRTSAAITTPLPITVCALAGSIAITAKLEKQADGHGLETIGVDLTKATVAINWSAAALHELTNQFRALAAAAVTTFVQSTQQTQGPLAFHVTAGVDGTFQPALRLERLEAHCIPNAVRSKQALGVFAIMLAANDAKGDHTQKTQSAITAAHNGVAISISPQTFHSLIFCPAIASALGTTVSHLPTTCGHSGSLSIQGVSLKRVADGFADGHINVDGAVEKSGTCYDAHGTFHGSLTFTVSDTTLTPSLHMDTPSVNIDVPWYCWLAAGAVMGPVGLVVGAIVLQVVEQVASSLAGGAITSALGSGLPGVSLGALSDVSFTSVAPTTEGLTLQGDVPALPPYSFADEATIALNGGVVTLSSHEIASGTLHTKVWCMPAAKNYPYIEYAQQQRGTYTLTGTLVSQPLIPHFALNGVQLTSKNGTVELSDVNVHFPMPLGSGGSSVQQTVHIGYSISGDRLELTNMPSEGNYSIQISATPTDCMGHPVQDNEHNDLGSRFISVMFEGDYADIGGGYVQDTQTCIEEMIRKALQQHKPVPYPSFQTYPHPDPRLISPEQMIRLIREIAASGLPQADQMLVAMKIAYANAFDRALLSPAAAEPALVAPASPEAADKKTLADVAVQLASLSQRLLTTAGAARRATAAESVAEEKVIVN